MSTREECSSIESNWCGIQLNKQNGFKALKGLLTRAKFVQLITGKQKEVIGILCGEPDKIEDLCSTIVWEFNIGGKAKHLWKTYHTKKTTTDYVVIIAFPKMHKGKAFLSFYAHGYILNWGKFSTDKSNHLKTWDSAYPPHEDGSRWESIVVNIEETCCLQ